MGDEDHFSPINESDTGIDKGAIEETLFDMNGMTSGLRGMCFVDKWPCVNRDLKCNVCVKINGTPSEFKKKGKK